LIFKRLSLLIERYGLASDLQINWHKSLAYWISPDRAPHWLSQINCQWAMEHQLSKLLGSPFGINLHTTDVDEFLAGKVKKKLAYWTSIHLSLAGHAIIVNSILLSTLWYFIAIWGGSLAIIRKLRASMRDFLWSGTTHRSQARVSWTDCCASKQIGGLDLVDPEEALHALMAKWILKAMLPGSSNLHLLLRYRLFQIRPQSQGN